MKNWAFKRAKDVSSVKGLLHPEFIVEFADTTAYPRGFHKVSDGYDILGEDLFFAELAKNEDLHQKFLGKKEELAVQNEGLQQAIATRKLAEEKMSTRELEEFARWKKSKRGLKK